MNKADFKRAFDMADNKDIDLSDADLSILDGCGLPEFRPVTAHIRSVARMLRWQALNMYGSEKWNNEALTECQNIFRHKVTMVG